MTPEAAAAWKPEKRIVGLRPGPRPALSAADRRQDPADGARRSRRSSSAASGSWPRRAAKAGHFFFKLAKVDGQLAGRNGAARALTWAATRWSLELAPRALYFFNPARDMLVPGPGLPAAQPAARAGRDPARPGAAEGPDQPARQRRRHAAPPGTTVNVSVPVELGVATVALSDAAGSLRGRRIGGCSRPRSSGRCDQISPRVRITVGGAPLLPDEPDRAAVLRNFSRYDPTSRRPAEGPLRAAGRQDPARSRAWTARQDIAARPLNRQPAVPVATPSRSR